MKSFVAIGLLCCFLLPLGIKVCILTNYEFNIHAITQKYCVNKDKPKMHCNGKCHLAKSLKALSTEENNNHAIALHSWLKPIQLLYGQKKHSLMTSIAIVVQPNYSTTYLSLDKGFLRSVFTPPQIDFISMP
jgi:hypothetical protein